MNKKLQKSSSSVQLVMAFCLSHDLFCASTHKGPVIFPRAPLWWPSRSPWAILPSGLHHVPCHIPFLALLLYFAAHLIFYLFFSPEEQKQFVFLIWLFLKYVCFWANSEVTQGAELNLKRGKVHLYRLWDGEGKATQAIIMLAPQKVVKERVGKRSLSRCGNQCLRKGPHRNVHVSVWGALP